MEILTSNQSPSAATLNNLQQKANEYFATINPIAQKITIDIGEVQSAYEHLWHQFNPSEQCDVIDEQLIRPEICIKYFDNYLLKKQLSESSSSSSSYKSATSSVGGSGGDAEDEQQQNDIELLMTSAIQTSLFDGKHLKTFSKLKTGLKKSQDDVCGIYRDEHSRPFSVKTKSQINLNLFDTSPTATVELATSIPKTKQLKTNLLRLSHTNNTAKTNDVKATIDKPTTTTPHNKTIGKIKLPLAATKKSSVKSKLMEKINYLTNNDGSSTAVSAADKDSRPLLPPPSEQQQSPSVGPCTAIRTNQIKIVETTRKVDKKYDVKDEEEDDDDDDIKQNFDEFNSLLAESTELKKTYDFLNNW